MNEEYIDIRVRLQDAQAVLAGLDRLGATTRRAGEEVSGAGRKGIAAGAGLGVFSSKAGVAQRSVEGLHSKVSGLGSRLGGAARAAIGFGLAFAGWSGVKSSISAVENMATNMRVLHGVMGMNTQQASDWAGIAQEFGIKTSVMARSFSTLGKQVESAGQGSKKSTALFNQLGISQAWLARHGNDANAMMGKVADGLNHLPPGLNRAAIASQLLGRNWQTLGPLLSKGSRGLDEQRRMMKEYGIEVGNRGAQQLERFHAASLRMNLAMLGIKLTLGTALMPVLSGLMGRFSIFVAQMRTGHGAGGQFATVLRSLVQVLKNVEGAMLPLGRVILILVGGVLKFLAQHPHLTAMLGTFLSLVVIVNKIIMVVKAWTIVQTALDVVLDANPIGVVVLAIGALIAIVLVVINHFKEVKRIFMDVFNWLKAHPYALALIPGIGPFLAIILTVVTHFKEVKHIAGDVFNWLKGAFTDLWNWIQSAAGTVLNILIWPFKTAWQFIESGFNALISFIGGIPGTLGAIFADVGKAIANAFIDGINVIIDALNALIGAWNSTAGSLPFGIGKAVSVGTIGHIPHMAEGGHITKPGLALVGERGPEILDLPVGARVTPLSPATAPEAPRRATAVPFSQKSMQRLAQTIVAKVYLDRRQIAEAVGETTLEREARA